VRAIDATVEKDGVDTPVTTWAALAASAKAGGENADLVLSRSQLASVNSFVQQAVDGVVAEKIEVARPAIVPAGGGVLLSSPTLIGDAKRRAGDGEAGPVDDDVATVEAGAAGGSLLERWARLQRHATEAGLKPFMLEGLVTATGGDAAGTTLVRIDPGLDATRTAAAGAYALWALFAAILMLVNGVLFALRLSQSMRRGARLRADVAMRPAPGATGVF
jgi:hypothetical protein